MPQTTKAARRTLVSINETATHLGCTTRTIRRYIAEGRLTGYRLGPRLVRLDLSEVESLLRPIPTARGGHDDAA
ncbi:MAG: helix-turn-helix domain-containing protein [Propionibacteriales bacterium]|nr:helix-turn-helix domain-containing protein [Propionibacteriales bacterium]